MRTPALASIATVAVYLIISWKHDLSLLQKYSKQALHQQATVAATGLDSITEQLGQTHRRSLLQNPDRPALNKYGGVPMEKTIVSGYPLETHKVNTKDGWILTLFRIPRGKNRHTQPGKRPAVYLQHGITLSSASFTLLNENESLAYILADAGFDVWMGNTRSNTFSRGNYKYSFRDYEYWYHTVDEYALVDMPAMLNTALQVSGANKLGYIGHSQGCTIGYAMLAALPDMNAKISVMIHMGPVVFVDFFRAPLMSNWAVAKNAQVLLNARLGEFLWYRVLAPFLPQCKDWVMTEACAMSLNYMFFGPSSFIPMDDFIVIGQTWPASVSSRNLQHWTQMYNDKDLRFQQFDYGTRCNNTRPFHESCNQQKYGSTVPPEYNLGAITAPQIILEGEMDVMSTTEDVDEQRRHLKPDVLVAELVYQSYAHMDYVYDRSPRHAFDVVDALYRFAPGTY